MSFELQPGQAQTAVSLMPRNIAECLSELVLVQQKKSAIDLLEWRLDYWQEPNNLLAAAQQIMAVDLPLILTLRTTHDGGLASREHYFAHYEPLISAQIGHVIDIEWTIPAPQRHQLAQLAHAHDYQVLLSDHDLTQTPDNTTLFEQLSNMQADLDGDILKLATNAQSTDDTTRLLAVTQAFTHQFKTPLITMAMSELGLASRIFGGQFGSAVSFGYLANPSAPGQLPIEQLKGLLTTQFN